MQQAASLFFALIFLFTPLFGWYQGRTDLPDGDAESSCTNLEDSDIGQDLPDQFKSDYSKIPKGKWFRLRGQIRRMSYDSLESILRPDDAHRQGNCYFQSDSGIEAEYIQNIHFPRSHSSNTAYNYYFSASMADYDGGIQIQLEWYDDNNELLNSTSIHSYIPAYQPNTMRLYPSHEGHIGKVVSNAKTMLIRIMINSYPWRSENTQHSIDMISLVFFPDHTSGNGRPGK